MITGIGIASQQANEHSRILILRANLAFVRTKALLATVMVLRIDTLITLHQREHIKSILEVKRVKRNE